jgi:coproporphyrinogen III oxidase-like Fe-S oxidoreductase
VLKLHTSWRRLGGLQERLWVESGSSTPHLRELLMLACRRVAPLSLTELRGRSGRVDSVLGPHLDRWVERGLCRVVEGEVHFTPEARRLADSLAAEIF